MPVLALLGAFRCLGASSSRDAGIADFHAGRYAEALAKLQQASAANPSDATARIFLALTQAARNDCVSALPMLSAPPANADSILLRLAGIAAVKCDESKADLPAAFGTLARLEQRFPNDPDVLYIKAKFHMKAFNDTTLAMFQHTAASYRVHQLSAEIFEVQGRFDEAVAEYQKAIRLNPNASDLHFRLGRALLMQAHGTDNLKRAHQEFLAELKVNPEDAATEFQLGQLAQVEGSAEEARSRFTQALRLYPNFPEALIALGRLEAQARHYSRAIELLEHSVKLQPANESAHYALMMAYRDSGQVDKAKAQKIELDRLQRPPEGEFNDFLKKLGEKPAPQ